jgi:hypothetical protein
MKLNPEDLDVASFDTVGDPQADAYRAIGETGTPTAATMCEFCASDSGCW